MSKNEGQLVSPFGTLQEGLFGAAWVTDGETSWYLTEHVFKTTTNSWNEYSSKVVSDAMLAELKECFLEAYDDNKDGKIDIREVSQSDRRAKKCSLGCEKFLPCPS